MKKGNNQYYEEEITENAVRVKLYPNPNNGIFELSFSSALNEEVFIEIYDINSRLINRFTERMNNKNTISIKNENLKNGIYFIKINSKGITEVIKFVKK